MCSVRSFKVDFLFQHVNHYTSEPEALNSSMRSDYGQYHRQATRVISDGFSDESSRDNSITSSGIHDHSFPNSVLSGVAYDYIRSSNDSLGGYQDFSSSLNPKQQMDTYSVGIIFDRTVGIEFSPSFLKNCSEMANHEFYDKLSDVCIYLLFLY